MRIILKCDLKEIAYECVDRILICYTRCLCLFVVYFNYAVGSSDYKESNVMTIAE
jgi:hypothetical protein